MARIVTVVDDYIASLLRDASIRVGIFPARTRAREWGKLLSTDECDDDAQRVENIKRSTYVVHHLLNTNKLTDSFSKYFEKRMEIPFNKDNVVYSERGVDVTLINLFRHKICRFKANFTYYTRSKCNMSISRGENEFGGKGKQLTQLRTHSEVLERRNAKRAEKKKHQGRTFFLNYYLSNGEKYIKPLVFSNDMDWSRWEKTFDPMFWMTPDERKERLQKKMNRVQDERDVAEALFGLFRNAESNAASFIPDPVCPNEARIKTAVESAGAVSDVAFHNDEMDFEQTIEEAVSEIVNEGDPFDIDLKDDFLVEGMKDRVHEIPVQDVSVCAKKNEPTSFVTDHKGVLILDATEKGANVIPVDNTDRDKKERERGIKLNRKNSNSILKYTVEHKGGIQATEKRKRKGNQSNNTAAAGNTCKKKRREVNAKAVTTITTAVKRKNNSNDTVGVAKKMVCLKFWIFLTCISVSKLFFVKRRKQNIYHQIRTLLQL